MKNETLTRVISALFLLAYFIFAVQYTGLYFLPLYLFGYLFLYLGIKEFYTISKTEEGRAFSGFGQLIAFIIYNMFYVKFLLIQTKTPKPDILSSFVGLELDVFFFALIMLTVLGSLLLQIIKRPADGAIFSVSTTLFGILYIALPLGHFLLLMGYTNSLYYIWLVCGITMWTDTGGYFGGRFFGRHPTGLKISPKKTYEGYVTGVICAILYVFALNFVWEQFFHEKTPVVGIEGVLFSIFISLVTVVGDLAESAVKRDAKVKDSASVIPGHGGVLDRIDSLVFTIPVSYYYIKFKSLLGFFI
ncbi:MAG: phosphatidate cytidylyltransferase [Leptospiraceae bacterium]|nr:phosphatidate cytidylyltransferase [Leptospiraceae bacterium]MCP5494592.1 phosphatidate cytidylyltransferase [Leptospiraceae bacterium]